MLSLERLLTGASGRWLFHPTADRRRSPPAPCKPDLSDRLTVSVQLALGARASQAAGPTTRRADRRGHAVGPARRTVRSAPPDAPRAVAGRPGWRRSGSPPRRTLVRVRVSRRHQPGASGGACLEADPCEVGRGGHPPARFAGSNLRSLSLVGVHRRPPAPLNECLAPGRMLSWGHAKRPGNWGAEAGSREPGAFRRPTVSASPRWEDGRVSGRSTSRGASPRTSGTRPPSSSCGNPRPLRG